MQNEQLPPYQTGRINSGADEYLFWPTEVKPSRTPALKEIRDEVVCPGKPKKQSSSPRKKRRPPRKRCKAPADKPLETVLNVDKSRVLHPPAFSWMTTGAVPFGGGDPTFSEVQGVANAGQDFMETAFGLAPGETGVAPISRRAPHTPFASKAKRRRRKSAANSVGNRACSSTSTCNTWPNTSNSAKFFSWIEELEKQWKLERKTAPPKTPPRATPPMVPGRFKDFISTPKRNGYQSLHTTVIHDEQMRIEIQIRTREMHAQAEHGLAAHWAYKEGKAAAKAQHPWISDLVEILEHAGSAEELLEHTRMAMYQDRIFAFTPKGELIQLPKGATPVDFAYAVHTDLGDQTVGAKVNGRVMPLRTPLENGDQVEILVSKAQHPQPAWLSFVVTGKARAKIRRFVKSKEREETVALGRKIFEEIVQRLPSPLGWEAMAEALKRLHLHDDEALMEAIALKRVTDVAVMEALMPGSTSKKGVKPPPQQTAISIKGLTPGVAFDLAECCHPVPGDRIVGLRREGDRHRSPHDRVRHAWPKASMPTGSTLPGAMNPTAAPHASASSSRTSLGSLAVVAGHHGQPWRQYRQPGPGRPRRQLPHLPDRYRSA